jgi:hypothetical protein
MNLLSFLINIKIINSIIIIGNSIKGIKAKCATILLIILIYITFFSFSFPIFTF